SDVKKSVNARQSRPDHERAHTAAEEKIAIPCDEHGGRNCGDQVGQPEAEKFRDRQKEEVKKAQGRAHHQVLKGMDLLSRRHFKEKEGGEDEDAQEHAV